MNKRSYFRAVSFLLLLGLWQAVPSPAQAQNQIAAQPDTTILSREICSGLFVVPLVWTSGDGVAHEFLALFDTGAEVAFIDPESLEQASGKRVKPGKRVRMEDVSVAGQNFKTFRPKVRDLDHLSRALGREIDVFLPFQAFSNYLLILDYEHEELRMTKGTLPKPDGIEVFSARGKDKRPWLSVRVGSRDRSLLLDSGSNGAFEVDSHRGLEWVEEPVPAHVYQRIDRVRLRKAGRLIGDFVVGPLVFENPMVTLTNDTELIGSEVLRHYVLTFDQKNRRVRMRPLVESPVRLPSIRGTGALFRTRPNAYEIAHVMRDSPAEHAGLRKGDLVTHLDGTPVLERGCRAFDKPPVESVRFTLLRDDEALEVMVPVRVLIQ